MSNNSLETLLIYFSPLKYQISLSSRSNNIVLLSFTSSKGNRLGSRASAITAVREKTRAQLFNLSPHSHAEQAWAGGGGGEKSFASSVGMTYFSKDPSTNRCKQTSRTRRNLDCLRCRWHNKPGRQNSVASCSCGCTDMFVLKWNPRFPSLPHFSSPCPSFCLEEKHKTLFVDSFIVFWLLVRVLSLTQGENTHTFAYLLLSPLYT